MNKKKIVIIIIAISAIICIVVISRKNKNKNKSMEDFKTIEESNKQIEYSDATGLYYLKNYETEEIIIASYDESEVQFYIDHPDYNPDPLTPRSKSLEDFLAPGENLEMTEKQEY